MVDIPKFNPKDLLAGLPTHINPINNTSISQIPLNDEPRGKAPQQPPANLPQPAAPLYDGTDPMQPLNTPLSTKPTTRRV